MVKYMLAMVLFSVAASDTVVAEQKLQAERKLQAVRKWQLAKRQLQGPQRKLQGVISGVINAGINVAGQMANNAFNFVATGKFEADAAADLNNGANQDVISIEGVFQATLNFNVNINGFMNNCTKSSIEEACRWVTAGSSCWNIDFIRECCCKYFPDLDRCVYTGPGSTGGNGYPVGTPPPQNGITARAKEEESSGGKTLAVVLIVVGVLVAIIVTSAIVLYVKKRKTNMSDSIGTMDRANSSLGSMDSGKGKENVSNNLGSGKNASVASITKSGKTIPSGASRSGKMKRPLGASMERSGMAKRSLSSVGHAQSSARS